MGNIHEKSWWVVAWQKHNVAHRSYFRTKLHAIRHYQTILADPDTRNLMGRNVDEWYKIFHPSTDPPERGDGEPIMDYGGGAVQHNFNNLLIRDSNELPKRVVYFKITKHGIEECPVDEAAGEVQFSERPADPNQEKKSKDDGGKYT